MRHLFHGMQRRNAANWWEREARANRTDFIAAVIAAAIVIQAVVRGIF